MTEYLTMMKGRQVESDYIPNVEKLIKRAIDPLTHDEIRIKVAKMSGKIIDQLSKFSLARKY